MSGRTRVTRVGGDPGRVGPLEGALLPGDHGWPLDSCDATGASSRVDGVLLLTRVEWRVVDGTRGAQGGDT